MNTIVDALLKENILTDEQISELSRAELFSAKMLDYIYSHECADEQERLKALVLLRSKDLDAYLEMVHLIKKCDAEQERYIKEQQRDCFAKKSTIALDLNAKGIPITSVDNFLKILRNDSRFSSIRYNCLFRTAEIKRVDTFKRWSDSDDSEMRRYIEKEYHLHNLQKLEDAFKILLAEREHNPVKSMISRIEWDGKSRIRNFLSTFTLCEDTPYTREVSRLIFAGGINRAYKPGCKFDCVPVLIGTSQGEGKSTLVRWLAMRDDLFNEVNEIDGQRGIEALEGGWICELSELLAVTKTRDTEAVKSYITRQVDSYRAPYDRRTTEYPRQCIFIGTTNKAEFLTDKTGNRRFFPVRVRCNGYNINERKDEIKEYIAQCWAEALHLYKNNQLPPYPDINLIDDFKAAQESATEDDYRVGMIGAYLCNKKEVCIIQLWQEALANGCSKPEKKDSNEIGLIMQGFPEWKKSTTVKYFPPYKAQRYWYRKLPIASYDDIELIE